MRYSILKVTVEQLKSVGATNIKEISNIKVIYADLSDEQVTNLQQMGAIIQENRQIKLSVLPPAPVQAQPVYTPSQLFSIAGYNQLRSISSPPLYGSGFNLAIIGTGIRETHQLINNRVVYSKNYTNDTVQDGFDHDTGVCSIAVAIAPLCNILNLKVIDNSGNGTEEGVVLAIDDCITMREEGDILAPHVINLSLGAPDTGDPNDVMRLACRAAIERDIWIVAAAGNSGPSSGTITSPACEKYVLCIGSIKLIDSNTFTISSFSSRGPTIEDLVKPDGVMFGEDIIMASSKSDIATIAKSGTSFATPFSSGFCICVREGLFRHATANVPIGSLDPARTWDLKLSDLLDKAFHNICIKPQGEITGIRDNVYGYGLPFGPTALQLLQPTGVAGMDITTIFSAIMPLMIMIPMASMFSKMGEKDENAES